MISKIIKLLCIIICMITIFNFSSDSKEKSSKKSDKLIVSVTEKFLRKKLSNKEKEKYISKYVFYVRKSAHFTLYFILGLLIISFLREFIPLDKKTIIITVILVLIYACSDEIHQMFIPGRSGELRDVLIDTLGGLIGSTIYYQISKIRRNIHE